MKKTAPDPRRESVCPIDGKPREHGKLFCLSCWRSLPRHLTNRVWRTYRAQPYNRGEHLGAIRECLVYLKNREAKGGA